MRLAKPPETEYLLAHRRPEGMRPMAKNIYIPAAYEDVVPSDKAPPPGLLFSGYYHCTTGYRVVRPRGSGSWLLFFTVAGQGVLRQPGLELRSGPGEIALLAPDAHNDYGVPLPRGSRTRLAVKPGYRPRDIRFVDTDGRWGRVARAYDPTHAYIRHLHMGRRHAVPPGRPGWRFHWVHFQPRDVAPAALNLEEFGEGLYRGAIAARHKRRRLDAAFQRLHRDLLSAGPFSELLALAALDEILLLVAGERLLLGGGGKRGRTKRRREKEAPERAPLDGRIGAALERIRSDLAAPHTVARLAREAHLSPSRFAHLFKEQTGRSVAQTVLALRVRQARKMLALSGERVGEIAYALGFCSPFHFSQIFKKQTGQSPRAYRRQSARK